MELSAEFKHRFVKSVNGKEFVLYGGLLELARQRGLLGITVDVQQIPSKDNGMLAICKATAFFEGNKTFTDVGDASPENVNQAIAKHIVRMASTRAKARALRDALGIDMVSFEELADVDDVVGDHGSPSGQAYPSKTTAQATPGDRVINFGKYNGVTLRKLKETDPQYLEWLAHNAKEEALRKEAQAVLNGNS